MISQVHADLLLKKDYPGFDKTRSENQFKSTKLNWDILYGLECGIN